MPTQGSWRPLVEISVSAPFWSIVGTGVRIDEVGLKPTRTTTGWPVEMPPTMPPAWLDRKCGRPSGPARIASAFSSPLQPRGAEAVADLDALHRVDRHAGGGQLRVELGIERRPPAGGHAGRHAFDDRAERAAVLARGIDQSLPARRRRRVGAEEGIGVDLRIIERRAVDRRRRRARPDRRGSSPRGSPAAPRPPAATRDAVSRAEARPEPRQSRWPYLA